ncbi:hypothetical protein [Alloactinosynnema sp. L-07]|nr:hypothetical protein [Alloactinosynnema sp. L-07]CRK59208.1 hypothetical protein [Alloactinosynnema sp. L-07]
MRSTSLTDELAAPSRCGEPSMVAGSVTRTLLGGLMLDFVLIPALS